jgi:hypothetical protein
MFFSHFLKTISFGRNFMRARFLNLFLSTCYQRRIAIVSCVIAFVSSIILTNAWADNKRTPFQDHENKLGIGAYALGMPKTELPANLERAPCGTAPSPGEEICEYFDIDGFAYLVDNKEVIRTEARLGVLTKFGRLPLDLKLGDTRKIVLTKLAAYAKKLNPEDKKTSSPITQLGKGKQYNQSTWATFDCVANSRGVVGSWYLTFDKYGRLVTVGVRSNV